LEGFILASASFSRSARSFFDLSGRTIVSVELERFSSKRTEPFDGVFAATEPDCGDRFRGRNREYRSRGVPSPLCIGGQLRWLAARWFVTRFIVKLG
jgi:hypothetical protein